MDRSLDDIIKENKKSRDGKKEGGSRRKFRKSESEGKARRFENRPRNRNVVISVENNRASNKSNRREDYDVLIDNLRWDIDKDGLLEVFGDYDGFRRVSIQYDRSGRSEGKATISFDSYKCATRFVEEYDGVPLDERKMRITLLSKPENDKKPVRKVSIPKNDRKRDTKSAPKKRRDRKAEETKKEVKAEDLDKELDDYRLGDSDKPSEN